MKLLLKEDIEKALEMLSERERKILVLRFGLENNEPKTFEEIGFLNDYENYEDYYTFPIGEFKGDDLFMLRVQGTSMIDAGIMNGDKIIVRRQNTAENGEIVVALVEDSATVKRFYRKDRKTHFYL